jgi:hypothetical protein
MTITRTPAPAHQAALPPSAREGDRSVLSGAESRAARVAEPTNVPANEGGIGVFFGLIAVGLAFAVCCGAALSWDGSLYLLQVLDAQAPFVANGRLITWLLHWPVVVASWFTDDLSRLQLFFGLMYAAIPLLALATSWWVVRGRAPQLFVWAALGIGLGTLPGQFFFVAEATLTVQLMWPVLLAILVGMRREHLPLIALCSGASFFSHPSAIGVFATLAGLASVVAWRRGEERHTLLRWAALFAGLAALAAGRFWLFRTRYESDQVSLAILRENFGAAVFGLPLLALCGAWIAGALIALTPIVARSGSPRGLRAVRVAEIVALLVAGGALLLWASNPQASDAQRGWGGEAGFRTWVLVCSLPFVLLAALDSLASAPLAARMDRAEWSRRVRVSQLSALIFTLVLSVQGTAWLGMTQRLRETITDSPTACISMQTTGGLRQTPLNHWSITSHSLLMQGRQPRKAVMPDNRCDEVDFAAGDPLDPNFDRRRGAEWFDLRPLARGLSAGQVPAGGCRFALTNGWHQAENQGRYWWRWSDGRDAQIRVVLDRDATVTLGGQIETARAPNQIAIAVNGQPQGTIALLGVGLSPLETPPLALRAGINTIQVVSRNPPIPAEADGRPLALSVANLTLTFTDGGVACAFRP